MTLKIAQEQELLQQNPDITNHWGHNFLFVKSWFHYIGFQKWTSLEIQDFREIRPLYVGLDGKSLYSQVSL